jgi:hypothetical protein
MMIKWNMKIVLLNIFYQKFASCGKIVISGLKIKEILKILDHRETTKIYSF